LGAGAAARPGGPPIMTHPGRARWPHTDMRKPLACEDCDNRDICHPKVLLLVTGQRPRWPL